MLRNGHAEILPQYCFRSEFAEESWTQEYGCAEPDFSKMKEKVILRILIFVLIRITQIWIVEKSLRETLECYNQTHMDLMGTNGIGCEK